MRDLAVVVVLALSWSTMAPRLHAQRLSPVEPSYFGPAVEAELRTRDSSRARAEPRIQPILLQERRPSFAAHLLIGGAIGGAVGYMVARARTSDGGTESMIPDGAGYAFGAVIGTLVGGLIGWGVYVGKTQDD